jgi:hypothetical protein
MRGALPPSPSPSIVIHTKLLAISGTLQMYLFFCMELGLNDFEVSYIHYSSHWKGWALKIETFLGLNVIALLVAISRPKKVLIFGAHLFQWPLKWM